jgi:hypothetical protein
VATAATLGIQELKAQPTPVKPTPAIDGAVVQLAPAIAQVELPPTVTEAVEPPAPEGAVAPELSPDAIALSPDAPTANVDPAPVTSDLEENQAQTPVTAIASTPQRVQGRVNLGYSSSGGGYDGFGRLEFFAPLYQQPAENVVFAEGKLLIDNDVNFGGNLRVGYRQVLNNQGQTLGGYIGVDRRDTGNRGMHQIGVGVETVGELWSVRANGYIPVGDTRDQVGRTFTNANFAGNRLLYDANDIYESALGGFDLEAGSRLAQWQNVGNLYGYIGPYFLTGEGADDTWGIRSRLAMEINSGLNLGVGVQHDDLFGTNAVFSITASVPNGPNRPQRETPDAQAVALANLSQPVARTEAIVVDVQQETQSNQVAINPATNQPYFFIHVQTGGTGTGTIESPYGFGDFATATASAGTDGNFVVYANETQPTNIGRFSVPANVQVLSTGPVEIVPLLDQGIRTAPIQLPGSGKGAAFYPNITGQATLNAGSRLSGFDFVNAGLNFTGTGGGANVVRPPISTSCVPISNSLTLVENVTISTTQNDAAGNGVEVDNDPNVVICNSTITTAGEFAAGVRVANDGAATLLNNTITTTGGNARGVIAQDDGQVTLTNNTITTTTNPSATLAVGVEAFNNGRVTINSCQSITTSGNRSYGVYAYDNGSVDIENCTITTSGLASPAILLERDAEARIANVTVSTTGNASPGIEVFDAQRVEVVNSTITTADEIAHGVLVRNDGAVTLLNNTITTTGNNARGVLAQDGGQVTLTNDAITTTGQGSAYGVEASNNGRVTINSCQSITTSGDTAFGIRASNNGSVDVENCTITTSGAQANAIKLDDDTNIRIANNTLSTTGLQAGAINISNAQVIEIINNTISTTGNQSAVFIAPSTGTLNQLTITDNTIDSNASSVSIAPSGGVIDNITLSNNNFTSGPGGFTVQINDANGGRFGSFINISDNSLTAQSTLAGASTVILAFGGNPVLTVTNNTLTAAGNNLGFDIFSSLAAGNAVCVSQFSGNIAAGGRQTFFFDGVQAVDPSGDNQLPTVQANNTGTVRAFSTVPVPACP